MVEDPTTTATHPEGGETTMQSVVSDPDFSYRDPIQDSIINRKRKRMLKGFLSDRGITDAQTRREILPTLPLADLRRIHFLSIPTKALDAHKGIGSVGIEIFNSDNLKRETDANDPYYSVDVSTTDKILRLHFAPFGIFTKSDENDSMAMFLGALDLMQTVDWGQTQSELPAIVKGFTNVTQARFAVKHLGFHASGKGIHLSKGFRRRRYVPMREEEVTDMLSLRTTIDNNKKRQPWLDIFISGKDFFSQDTKDRAQKVVDLFHRRLAVGDEDVDSVERRARVIAINTCLANQ